MTKGLSNFSNLTSGVILPYAGEARQEINAAEDDLKDRLQTGIDLKKFLEDNGGADLVSGDIKYNEADLDRFLYVKNSSDSINKALDSGTEEEAQQHWSKALEYCNKAIELNPNAGDQYHNRGTVYFNTGFLEEALDDFYKELEISPNCASYNSIGMIYHNQEKYKEAIDSFNAAIALDPDASWHHHNRGLSHLELGLPEKAFEDFSRDIKINPNSAASFDKIAKLGALRNKAISSHEQGRELQKSRHNEEAIECFSHAIELFPDKHWQHFDRGLSYFRTGLEKEALDDFSKELEINPHPIAQERSNHEMAFIYISIQDYDKSKYHSKKVIEIDNDANLVARAKLNVGYLEDRAQKEADDKYWKDWRDYLFLGKQVAKLAVTVLLPVIRELLKKQNPADYLSEEDSEENVKTLARNMVEISLKFEGMPQKDRDALLAIDAEKSKEIFSAIFSFKDPTQLDAFISNALGEAEDQNKKELKETLKELHSSIIDTGTTRNKRNFVYDKIITDTDSSKHPIIPEKLEKFLKIFRDEASRYMVEIHDQVKKSEIENVLGELMDKVEVKDLLDDMIDKTEKPRSNISTISAELKLAHSKDIQRLS